MSFAFAYLRVSTEDQTIQNQRMQIESYAKKKEIPVRDDGWFQDEATSGTKPPLQRSGFKELVETLGAMTKVQESLPSCIYVYEISRWGRTFWETLEAIRCVEYYAIIISTSPKESFFQIEDKSMRKLFFAIFAWTAEREREILVQRVKEGVIRAHSEGKHSGNIPLGFEQVDGKLFLDPMGSQVKRMLDENPSLRPITVSRAFPDLNYKAAYNLLASVKKFGSDHSLPL